MELLRQLLAALDQREDPALVRARASGERVAAVVRTLVVTACVIILAPYLRGTAQAWLAVGALAYALGLLGLAWKEPSRLLAWISCTADVTITTTAISMFAIAGEPVAALNNRVFFDTYFFVIALAALRYEWRLATYAIALVLFQFGSLAIYLIQTNGLQALHDAIPRERFNPLGLVLRLVILAADGVTLLTLVAWTLHLRLLISRDPLTGLLHRLPFLERVNEEFARVRGGEGLISVAVLDIDHFKRFNDEHGHATGDNVLRILSQRLTAAIRTSDLLTRYGGEEFVLVFPRLSANAAAPRLEEIRQLVTSQPFVVKGRDHRVTVSIGVAGYPQDGRSFETVFEEADQRLYQAKRLGRDRVIGPS